MKTLVEILRKRYGVSVFSAPVEAILWAADSIENVEHARKELAKVNRIRDKNGRMPAYFPFGHRLF